MGQKLLWRGTKRFIAAPIVAGLSAAALAQAALVAAGALGLPAWLPGGRALEPGTLPGALAGLGAALALLLAPAWRGSLLAQERRLAAWGLAWFLGLWQGAACAFFLLVASRMSALEPGRVLGAFALVATFGSLAALLAARWPNAFPGLAVFWAAGVPMSCYILAELFRTTPPGFAGWAPNASDEAQWLHALVDAALKGSPGTAAVGALQGRLASGAEFQGASVAAVAGLGLAAGGLLVAGLRREPPAVPEAPRFSA
ncbi:MAG: hypothetical protein M5U26_09540 [Planctomycetota bacterium]|nr:hypothetical protein [Planctomycetota bacterium]